MGESYITVLAFSTQIIAWIKIDSHNKAYTEAYEDPKT